MKMTSRTLDATPASVALESLESRQLFAVNFITNGGALITTSVGQIPILLTPTVTPKTVQNFLQYVRKGLYNNTVVHRAVNQTGLQIVQMGGYKLATGYPHIPTTITTNLFGAGNGVPNEFSLVQAATPGGKVNVAGTVAMAKTSDPNSATSEFFVNTGDNTSNLDLTSNSGGFAVFGHTLGPGLATATTLDNLTIINATSANSAFDTLPVIRQNGSNNPITISSAKAQNVVKIDLNAGGVRLVTWTDATGDRGTVRLTGKGVATLTFFGGSDLRAEKSHDGSSVNVTGNGVLLEDVTTNDTTQGSTLTISSNGGALKTMNVGGITVNGAAGIGRIDGRTVQVTGDITASAGTISKIDLQNSYRSTISSHGNKTTVNIDHAIATSVNIVDGRLASLHVDNWTGSTQLPTSVSAKTIGTLSITGDFSSNIFTTGNVDHVKIDGNIGADGAPIWTVGGSLKSVTAEKVSGLRATVTGRLGSFSAQQIEPFFVGNSGTATSITANTIGTVTAASLASATISATDTSTAAGVINSIGSVRVSGLVDSSAIRSTRSIGSVSIGGSLTGTSAAGPSYIAAGINTNAPNGSIATPFTFTPQATGSGTVTPQILPLFTDPYARIGSLTIDGTFSNADVVAPVVGPSHLGTVRTSNGGVKFGVFSHVDANSRSFISPLTGVIANRAFRTPGAHDTATIKHYFNAQGLSKNLGNFTVEFLQDTTGTTT